MDSELSNVAWDLVEYCRNSLNVAEHNNVFVRLAIGDHGDAIEIALKAIVRDGGPGLPKQLVDRLTRLGETVYVTPDFEKLLESAAGSAT
ncbi:hypothetical protein PDG61_21090 [Mycolicibacterium sp. BiH015]|uniref:hypothetical protein n=1 Tax=Mycolicibacterium sp. BiH015 TaxID=3018808 RepID=UPI0022E4BBD9|nr:hypothetical protein [Mycolicibacterium sp. BiH015]MDA2893424.1 hypothetical protein [Mycolicibacterium sp. BiH015]